MELVIVIAVIAVLAAVLIPTFANIVDRANMSSDQQSVANMNKILIADSIDDKPESLQEIYDILESGGFKGDGLVAVSEGYEFAWMKSENKIVLLNTENRTVVYPDELSGISYEGEAVDDFYFLNPNETSIGAGTESEPYNISSAAAYNVLIEKFKSDMVENGSVGNDSSITYINIISDINLSNVTLPQQYKNGFIFKNVVIKGNGNTISGATGISALGVVEYAGLSNKIENLIFENCSVTYSLLGYGFNSNTASDKLEVSNVDVKSGSAYGGAFLFYTGSGQLSMTNCTVEEDFVVVSPRSNMATGGFVGNGQSINLSYCTMAGTIIGVNGSAIAGFVGQGGYDNKYDNLTLSGRLINYSSGAYVNSVTTNYTEANLTNITYSNVSVTYTTENGEAIEKQISIYPADSKNQIVASVQAPVLTNSMFNISGTEVKFVGTSNDSISYLEMYQHVIYNTRTSTGDIKPHYDIRMEYGTVEADSLSNNATIFNIVSKILQVVDKTDAENRTQFNTIDNVANVGQIVDGVYYFDARTNADTSYNYLAVESDMVITTFNIVAYDKNDIPIGNIEFSINYNADGPIGE